MDINIYNKLKNYLIKCDTNIIARQDCSYFRKAVQVRYYYNELKEYPKSMNFNALQYYNTKQYLTELLFIANIIDNEYQNDTKFMVYDINKQLNTKLIFRKGPVKNIKRSIEKVETEYNSSDISYPSGILFVY